MKKKSYFTPFEWCLWLGSVALMILSFLLFDRVEYFKLIASLVGVTALVFCAKGNPIGQLLIAIFAVLYGIISFERAYYGEMITYMGMSLPMAIYSLVVWLKHPFKGNKAQVEVHSVTGKEIVWMTVLTVLVTAAFYFILRALSTASLWVSTLSVTTSFLAVYLTARRSPYYALAYAANDVVLVVLWVAATVQNLSYLSVVICFALFLFNDLYSFVNWKRMQRLQQADELD